PRGLVLLDAQGPQQARALGQPTKQLGVVSLEPAVEAPKRAALQSEQQPDGHQLARPELCLRVLVPAVQPIVYQAEQPDDKIFAGHGARTSQLEAGHSQCEIPPWPSCQLAPVVSYGRKGGPKAGSRASSPGEQAAACDCQKTRELGYTAHDWQRLLGKLSLRLYCDIPFCHD